MSNLGRWLLNDNITKLADIGHFTISVSGYVRFKNVFTTGTDWYDFKFDTIKTVGSGNVPNGLQLTNSDGGYILYYTGQRSGFYWGLDYGFIRCTEPESTEFNVDKNDEAGVWLRTITITEDLFDDYTLEQLLDKCARRAEYPWRFSTYTNTAAENVLDKTDYLTNYKGYNGIIRDTCSVLAPIIELEFGAIGDVPKFNYVYIPSFGMYYYVTDVIFIANNIWNIELAVDPLMSLKDQILEQEMFIDRNEFEYNSFIVDEQRIIESGTNIYLSNSRAISAFAASGCFVVVSGFMSFKKKNEEGK